MSGLLVTDGQISTCIADCQIPGLCSAASPGAFLALLGESCCSYVITSRSVKIPKPFLWDAHAHAIEARSRGAHRSKNGSLLALWQKSMTAVCKRDEAGFPQTHDMALDSAVAAFPPFPHAASTRLCCTVFHARRFVGSNHDRSASACLLSPPRACACTAQRP
ncbi:hypothetical protein K491DRAFT_431950 [Lophiostoma macrostomum CBS 122681]|uniref:Uncharacterized protein n=1 Tax=Lophiostoma macrostomum CBS 122681 TaxID=1314788 RepID=A0A6A6T8T7_9PLEO|nr:hypothetical protein K491DRAFT_431950 [Lophiostoma macrostomum CBS 122681]